MLCCVVLWYVIVRPVSLGYMVLFDVRLYCVFRLCQVLLCSEIMCCLMFCGSSFLAIYIYIYIYIYVYIYMFSCFMLGKVMLRYAMLC